MFFQRADAVENYDITIKSKTISGLRGSPCKNRPLEFLKITDFLQTFCVEEVIHKMNKKR
jgi:hypothetical protein